VATKRLKPEGSSASVTVSFQLNGKPVKFTTHPMARLLDLIREDAHLTGTKEGCGEGECGACSIFLDGRLVNSCLIPALAAEGTKVVTIEGVSRGQTLHAVQRAFLELGGAQCGICTPGMVLAAARLLEDNPRADEADVRTALAGNLCRCTGYVKIVDAVLKARDELRGERR
jgi:aerobic-type carbon monoxide dehydrogenase small subunit (CoxS/CutS family)